MAVVDTCFDQLTEAERQEIDEAIASAKGRRFGNDRFVSDEGDTLAWFLLLLVASVGGIVACFVEGVVQGIPEFFSFALRDPLIAVRFPAIPGFFVAVVASVYCIVHFFRVHGRHGWLATSWGVVQIRGKKVRMLRYGDITKTQITRIAARHTHTFWVLKMSIKGGGSWSTYAGPLMEKIQARSGGGAG